jgi:uncharacterized protein YecE (DUF72 family)
MSTAPQATLWIGPSGWSYDDWQGIVYPRRKPSGFKPLQHIARYFNAVEVNSSFYRIPDPRMTAAWPNLVPSTFRFAFKLTQIFTHQHAAFPEQLAVRAFRDGVKPVREAGLLGPLLMQFPWSFRYDPASVDWLLRLAEQFADFDRFIEVRHASWSAPEALQALRHIGGYCNIDQPTLADCLGPTQHVFGSRAYVRLHGRNARHWFADNVPAFERYNYLYSDEELREWVRRLNAMSTEAEEIFAFANNHYRGQGPANALELKALLTGERVDVPPTLLEAFPRLASIARPAPEHGLFGPS